MRPQSYNSPLLATFGISADTKFENIIGYRDRFKNHQQESTLTLVIFHSKKKMTKNLTAIIEREEDGYVSLCPELDIASQGDTVSEARENLKEALELFFESASEDEITQRLHSEIYITQVQVAVG